MTDKGLVKNVTQLQGHLAIFLGHQLITLTGMVTDRFSAILIGTANAPDPAFDLSFRSGLQMIHKFRQFLGHRGFCNTPEIEDCC
jgi:hypothetical protein